MEEADDDRRTDELGGPGRGINRVEIREGMKGGESPKIPTLINDLASMKI